MSQDLHMSIAVVLRRSRLFVGIDASLLERLAHAAVTRSYQRGEQLWRAGEMPHALFFVKSGLVMVLRTSEVISRLVGQMSLRKTFLPFLSRPSGCFTRSEYIEPANA